MSGLNGGVIGAANVPTAHAASGVWRPTRVAQIIASATNGGVAWPTLNDANFSSVSCLYTNTVPRSDGYLHDSSGKGNHLAPSHVGIVTPKFGDSSTIFNSGTAGIGYGGLTSSDFTMGTGDFTIEGWFWFNDTSRFTNLLDFRINDNAVAGSGPILVRNGSGKLCFYRSGQGVNITGGTTISSGAWHHVHATRASGTTYLGLDGAQEGSDYTDANNYTSTYLWVATDAANFGTQNLYGRFMQIRVTKGVARYSRTYTVPTAPFPDY